MPDLTLTRVRKIVAIGVGIGCGVVLSDKSARGRLRAAGTSRIVAALAGAGVQLLLAKRAAHDATAKPAPPADDNTLADRVRTEVLRRADAPKGAVDVSVVDGVVQLRGELSRLEDIERLISAAGGVPGVRGVESMLHLHGVGTPSGAG
jgi:osmotically-inducible protein OsmY